MTRVGLQMALRTGVALGGAKSLAMTGRWFWTLVPLLVAAALLGRLTWQPPVVPSTPTPDRAEWDDKPPPPLVRSTAAMEVVSDASQQRAGHLDLRIHGYLVQVSGWEGWRASKVNISQGGRTVFSCDGDIEIGPRSDHHFETQWDRVGRCVTGNGLPDLVLLQQNGWHSRVRILELGPTLRAVPLAGQEAALGRLGESGRFCAVERIFEFWHGCHAEAALTTVPLKYVGKGYEVDLQAMREPAAPPAELECAAEELRATEWPDYGGDAHPPRAMKQTMLDLVYTGHADLAWKFCEAAWRPGVAGQARYLKDFKQTLTTSPYWPSVKALNGL